MKVFLSWSGDRSKELAEFLSNWLPDVIQAIEPWISSRDIPQGTRPLKQIADELSGSNFGIVCVTPESWGSQWINFEAGALSKVLEDAMVVPLLLGIEKAQVTGPLSQFQMTEIKNRNEVLKLISDINDRLGGGALTLDRLNRSFEQNWPALQEAFTAISTSPGTEQGESVERSSEDLLNEMLLIARRQERRLSKLEESYELLQVMALNTMGSSAAGEALGRFGRERRADSNRERALNDARTHATRLSEVAAVIDILTLNGVTDIGDVTEVHLNEHPANEVIETALREQVAKYAERIERSVAVEYGGKRIYLYNYPF